MLSSVEVANLRSSRSIGLEEMLFLMRKDKSKLRRLLRHLKLKDQVQNTANMTSLGSSSLLETPENIAQSADEMHSRQSQASKRFEASLEFLSNLDEVTFDPEE